MLKLQSRAGDGDIYLETCMVESHCVPAVTPASLAPPKRSHRVPVTFLGTVFSTTRALDPDVSSLPNLLLFPL
ncbi:hypothetical protein AV530_004227 [Patagioenas fasciata monilis]|uniref:Uncharacterized protein n=1 Tax=Patagioenas fasciata monilis TaxID=372326 RepID=A0A1V4KA80_PATFA|nr:hypothetical protein AV530_004227 [Patagioenas fasciata monilis]